MLGAHTPLVTDQVRMLLPPPRAVTVLTADCELVMAPLPVVIDQVPVPISGGMAPSVVEPELMQSVWLDPAKEVLGKSSNCTSVVAVLEQPPLVTSHCST